MTRQDLVNKSIDKLNTVKEANGGKTTLALAMAGIQNIVNE